LQGGLSRGSGRSRTDDDGFAIRPVVLAGIGETTFDGNDSTVAVLEIGMPWRKLAVFRFHRFEGDDFAGCVPTRV
jgi:hypothetical protein